jgi:hypothetical protein
LLSAARRWKAAIRHAKWVFNPAMTLNPTARATARRNVAERIDRFLNILRGARRRAMPVMPMTAEDVDVWLNGTREEALELQKPQPDDSLVITPYDEKKA